MSPEGKDRKRPILLVNWFSISGLIIAGGGLFAFIFLFVIDTFAHRSNPYLGILTYVVAPAFIILGIALAVFGAWRHQRALRDFDPKAAAHSLTIDFNRPSDRKLAIFYILGAMVFLMLTAFGSYQT